MSFPLLLHSLCAITHSVLALGSAFLYWSLGIMSLNQAPGLHNIAKVVLKSLLGVRYFFPNVLSTPFDDPLGGPAGTKGAYEIFCLWSVVLALAQIPAHGSLFAPRFNPTIGRSFLIAVGTNVGAAANATSATAAAAGVVAAFANGKKKWLEFVSFCNVGLLLQLVGELWFLAMFVLPSVQRAIRAVGQYEAVFTFKRIVVMLWCLCEILKVCVFMYAFGYRAYGLFIDNPITLAL